MTKDGLIKSPNSDNSHIFLLGAGASKAAFPIGEGSQKIVPLMDDFIQVLKLEDLLKRNGVDPHGNFEDIYSNITDKDLKKEIENIVYKYLSEMSLPDIATDYDRLLLSLRPKDAIFTFNWDPFLFDAYMRNYNTGIPMPEIFFLHGNVRLVACSEHYNFGYNNGVCDECGKAFQPVPLLYPIGNKDYPNTVNSLIGKPPV